MSAALLELDRVSRTFTVGRSLFEKRQPLRAVDDVSLRLHKGEVLGLVGESGCGKSTIAKMLLGLLAPSAGTVRLGGKPISTRSRRDISRRLQPVFQDPYASLNPRKTVAAIVSLPLEVHGIGDRAERRRRVREMLDVVSLPPEVMDSYASQLSGGQRQRVAIARALIVRPEILICDEPTSALDVSVQSQILNLLIRLRREFDLSYLFISHNLAVVEHLAGQVAVMYLGRIVEQADAETLFRAPRHPYTKALLGSVLTPVAGLGVPDTQLGVAFPNPIDPPPGCTFHPRCASAMAVCRTTPPGTRRDGRGMVECHLEDEAMRASGTTLSGTTLSGTTLSGTHRLP